VSPLGGLVKRRSIDIDSLKVGICSLRQEEFGYSFVTTLRGQPKRTHLLAIVAIGVCTAFEKKLYDIQMPSLGSLVNGPSAILGNLNIGIRLFIEQDASDVYMALLASQKQRGFPELPFQITAVWSGPKQGFDN